MTERVALTNGLRMYYEERGAGAPLVLLHGGTDTCRFWDPVVPYLADRFRVITPDSRGHGRTDNPAGKLSYPMMADDVVALCSALGLDQPAIGGWSDGGQIALEIGIRYPDAAGALIVGGAGYRFSEKYVRTIREAMQVRDDGKMDVDAWAAANPEAIVPLREAHQAVSGADHWKTLLRWCAELWLTPFDLTPADFAKIARPTLLMNGDHDEFFPVEETVELYRMIGPAKLAIFPGANHALPVSQPDVFGHTVEAYLQRHSVVV